VCTFLNSFFIDSEDGLTELQSLGFGSFSQALIPDSSLISTDFIESCFWGIELNSSSIEVNIVESLSSESNSSSLNFLVVDFKQFINVSHGSGLKPDLKVVLVEDDFESIPDTGSEEDIGSLDVLTYSLDLLDELNSLLSIEIKF